MIEVTDRAAIEIKNLLTSADLPEAAIRIYIAGESSDAEYGLALLMK